VILPRPAWPSAILSYIEGRRDVTTKAIAYGALCYPAGFPLSQDMEGYLAAALRGLGWRRESVKSGLWKRQA
jgi:hypothetical protein